MKEEGPIEKSDNSEQREKLKFDNDEIS